MSPRSVFNVLERTEASSRVCRRACVCRHSVVPKRTMGWKSERMAYSWPLLLWVWMGFVSLRPTCRTKVKKSIGAQLYLATQDHKHVDQHTHAGAPHVGDWNTDYQLKGGKNRTNRWLFHMGVQYDAVLNVKTVLAGGSILPPGCVSTCQKYTEGHVTSYHGFLRENHLKCNCT